MRGDPGGYRLSIGPSFNPPRSQGVGGKACFEGKGLALAWRRAGEDFLLYIFCMPRPGRAVFHDCSECGGTHKCPRNGRGGATCTASQCKAAYKAKNQELNSTVGLGDIAPQVVHEMMPPGKWLQDLEEILGERCCQPHQLSSKNRKNGPGSQYHQQFLVRGQFLEDGGGDGDDSEPDECPEWNTYWMDAVDLETIAKEDLKAALVARHERVIQELEE